jgi:hypothetical protein
MMNDCHCVVVRRFSVQKWISFEVVDVTPVIANHSHTLVTVQVAVGRHCVNDAVAESNGGFRLRKFESVVNHARCEHWIVRRTIAVTGRREKNKPSKKALTPLRCTA